MIVAILNWNNNSETTNKKWKDKPEVWVYSDYVSSVYFKIIILSMYQTEKVIQEIKCTSKNKKLL